MSSRHPKPLLLRAGRFLLQNSAAIASALYFSAGFINGFAPEKGASAPKRKSASSRPRKKR